MTDKDEIFQMLHGPEQFNKPLIDGDAGKIAVMKTYKEGKVNIEEWVLEDHTCSALRRDSLLGGHVNRQGEACGARREVRTANINVMRAYLGELGLVMHQARRDVPEQALQTGRAAYTCYRETRDNDQLTCTPWTCLPGWWRPWWCSPTST